MVARTNRHAKAVEERSEVKRVDLSDSKCHNGVFLGRCSEEAKVGDGTHLLHSVTRDFAFVSRDVVHTDGAHVIESRGQGMRTYVIGSTCFKLERQTLVGGFLKRDARNHFATTVIGRHFVKNRFLSVKHAYACGAIHLMAAEDKEIAIHILDIHGEMRGALRTINENFRPMFVGNARKFLNGVHRSEHVAHMCHTHQFRALCEKVLIGLHVQATLIRDRNYL